MTPAKGHRWNRSLSHRRHLDTATAFLAGGAAAVLGYYLLPAVAVGPLANTDLAQGVLFTAVSAAAAVAIVAGVAVHRPARPLPWLILAAGQVAFTVGDGLDVFVFHVLDSDGYPTVADPSYLLGYPLMAWSLTIFVRRRTPGWQVATLIDAMVIAIGVGLLGWVYVIEPIATAPDVTLAAKVVSVGYPVMDLFVLAVSIRLALGAGSRSPTFYLLLASSLAMLVADVSYAVGTERGTWSDGTWVDAAWLVEYLLLGAAALHPSMRRLDEQAGVAPPEATGARLVALAAASLTGPVVLLVQHLRVAPTHIVIVALSCATLSLLVLARMAELVAVHRRTAITDSLTGLHSRGYFQDVLRAQSGRAAQSHEALGVLLIDADDFKKINDTYGHPAGDLVLRELAERIRASCRPGDLIARYGGEEFAVLLAGADRVLVEQVAERIRGAVAGHPLRLADDLLIRLTISVGAAALRADQSGTEDVIKAADRALYAAKNAGRNRVVAAWDSAPLPH
ncbi:MAG TPA: GGDEF domain-containing protein [Catenuloplanes sp.]